MSGLAISNAPVSESFSCSRINACLKEKYTVFEHAWDYLGKIIILVRHILNTIGRTAYFIAFWGKDVAERIKKTATHLKLFSIVGVPSSLISLKSIGEKLSTSVASSDKEAIILGSLSFAIVITDLFDSVTTFINTMLTALGHSAIESLAILGIPLGFALAGMGTISRIIQIAKVSFVSNSIKSVRERILNNRTIGTPFTPAVLKAIPGEIETELHRLQNLIATNANGEVADQELSEISQVLDGIQARLNKKWIIDALAFFANILILAALSLFALGSVSSAPFLLLAFSFIIRISSLIYHDLTKGNV